MTARIEKEKNSQTNTQNHDCTEIKFYFQHCFTDQSHWCALLITLIRNLQELPNLAWELESCTEVKFWLKAAELWDADSADAADAAIVLFSPVEASFKWTVPTTALKDMTSDVEKAWKIWFRAYFDGARFGQIFWMARSFCV